MTVMIPGGLAIAVLPDRTKVRVYTVSEPQNLHPSALAANLTKQPPGPDPKCEKRVSSCAIIMERADVPFVTRTYCSV